MDAETIVALAGIAGTLSGAIIVPTIATRASRRERRQDRIEIASKNLELDFREFVRQIFAIAEAGDVRHMLTAQAALASNRECSDELAALTKRVTEIYWGYYKSHNRTAEERQEDANVEQDLRAELSDWQFQGYQIGNAVYEANRPSEDVELLRLYDALPLAEVFSEYRNVISALQQAK